VKKTTFVIGGCRSGKSRYGLELAGRIPGQEKIFIATCVPCDDEMSQRVARHRKERGRTWSTVEEPILLPEAVNENSRKADVILVDCMTLWISNLLLETDDQDKIAEQIDLLTESLEKAQCPVILISNEVGDGIVPENRLARLFRDSAGFANQNVAACSDMVVWMVAGIPVTIKGRSKS